MNKAFVDQMIIDMKRADMVAKASPWMVEGFGEKQMNVRFVGIKLKDDWLDIMSSENNLLMKFIIDRTSARVEFYLANKPPFFRIRTVPFSQNDKWDLLLGDIKRRLKKDKADVLSHTDALNNLYTKIKPLVR